MVNALKNERTVQHIKGIIRAYIDEEQENWDLNLEKKCLCLEHRCTLHYITYTF
jgi:hypothetical protein